MLDRAQSLYREIEELRPRWGPAIALGGRIAAAKGEHARAVELLGRGIRDGGGSLPNILLLVSELYALDRIDEAATELARISEFSDTVQQVSLWEIELRAEIRKREAGIGFGQSTGQQQTSGVEIVVAALSNSRGVGEFIQTRTCAGVAR